MEPVEHKKGKIYYSIGEVAEMFDLSPATIRFWESKFDILRPKKNKKGNRLFTPKDVDNIKLIHYFVKEKGMTLAGAQKQMKQNPEGVSRDMEIADRLLAMKAILQEIRESLRGGPGEVYHDDPLDDAAPKVGKVVVEEPAAVATEDDLMQPEPEDDFVQPEADALIDAGAEEEWVGKEILGLDELDSGIEELAEAAGITPAAADELIESPRELPPFGEDIFDAGPAADVPDAVDAFPPNGGAFITDNESGIPEITEEELAMLDDDTDYPPGDAPDEIAAVALEADLFSPAEGSVPESAPEPEKPDGPRIIEQTLF